MVNVSFSIIKPRLWKRVRHLIDTQTIGETSIVDFFYDGKMCSALLEINGTPMTGTIVIDVFIENLPVRISNSHGLIDLTFSIPYQEDCSVRAISINNWSKALDPHLGDLENHLILMWNEK